MTRHLSLALRCAAFLLICNSGVVAQAATLFQDNFNDGNLNGWTFQALPGDGSNFDPETVHFFGSNGALEMTTYGNERNRVGTVMSGASFSDYTVSARLRDATGTGTGPSSSIAGRVQSAGNFYDFGLSGPNNESISLRRFDNGNQNVLAGYTLSSPIGLDNWYDASISFSGDRIRAYLDGDLIFDVTDSVYSSGGFGVHTAGRKAYYDDFSARTLSTSDDLPPPNRQEPPSLDLPDTQNLVVYTHGFATSSSFFNDANEYWGQLGTALEDATSSEWGVVPWDWTDNNGSLFETSIGAVARLNNAADEGAELGRMIANQATEYEHIHLIGHSLGANLISVASQWIDTFSDSQIHTTFLDPFTPNSQYAGFYGAYSDWSDNYSVPDLATGFPLNYTYRELPNAHNVDVRDVSVDGAIYNGADLTFEDSHGWPIQFYLESILKRSDAGWDGTGYGFSLSEESGDTWPPNLQKGNQWVELGNPDTLQDVAPVFRLDSAIAVGSLASASSSLTSLVGSVIDMATSSPAWASMLVDVTDAVNFVTFDAEFVSEVGAEGLLAMYWDGELVSTVDERYALPGSNSYTMWLSDTMEPGTYELSFRLDPFTGVQSRAVLDNIQTGFVGVPEPSTLMLCVSCGILWAGLRKQVDVRQA